MASQPLHAALQNQPLQTAKTESQLAAQASQLKAVPKTRRKRKINIVRGCEQPRTEIIAALNYTKGSVHPCQRLEF